MEPLRKPSSRRERAAALIIVLALVVLLTGLVVAYFSRATSDRPVANSSFNQSKVDQLAQSAMDNIIGDLRQEITNGSTAVTLSPVPPGGPATLYIPTNAANMVPRHSPTPAAGNTPVIPNLIRRSTRSEPSLWPDPIAGPVRGSRASAVNSTADVSANGRSVSLARWNSHYLIPKANTGDDKSDPITPVTNGFSLPNSWPPDWVFVTNDPTKSGATVITAPSTSIVGRYAYVVYDEGGLVDMNAAGYPSPMTIAQYGRKGSLAFADLKGLGSFGLSSTSVDDVVGWRNYASAQPSGSLSTNFTFSTNSANTYYNFILTDPTYIQLTNFLPNTPAPLTYFTNYFLTPATANGSPSPTPTPPINNNQTDQAFTDRKSLIKFLVATPTPVPLTAPLSQNALQYLGTVSREAMASVPQWTPSTVTSINPNFQTLLVTTAFTRNDGTTANAGEYLVNQRFLLQRLNWLTYKGPSATVANGGKRNAVPTSAPAIGSADYDLWLLTRTNGLTFGLTSSFLQRGTDLSGTGQTASTANIYKYFGLVWDVTNERWIYIGHPTDTGGTPSATSPPASSIATLGSITGLREPDFFELLQAGILSGSLADFVASYPELPVTHQQSAILHILTIGANLIAQSRVDSYPVRIACTVGPTVMEAVGAPRLPYINGLAACPVGLTATTGGMNWLLAPNLWNPFRDSWDLTEANAGNSGNGPLLTPGYLRPPVRITIGGATGAPSIGGSGGSGTVNLGFTSTAPAQSGRVASASPVGGAPTVTILFSPLQLATGNVTSGTPAVVVGRDGFLQAMRLGSSDFTTAPTLFNPTTTLAVAPNWNTVARPLGDTATAPRSDNYVVFRISSSSALPTANYPALILNTGFQMTMDYTSPNGTWYSYSFLQGDNAINTWITANPNPLYIATNYSQYGTPPLYTAPTIVNALSTTVTRWDIITGGVAALAKAPMFVKADPRSIRYNSTIGWITLPVGTAGIIGSIWPNGTSAPTMQPGANPASYSQTTGDNAPAAIAGVTSNPYDQTSGDAVRPVMMNRPFRSVGEMGYAFRDQPFRTLSFSWAPTSPNPDAGLLDLFTTTAYDPTPTPIPTPSATPTATPTPTPTPRGGVINLNSQQSGAIAGVLTSTITREYTPRAVVSGAPSPTPSLLTTGIATNTAASMVLPTSSAPIVNRAGLAAVITPTPSASPSPSLLDSSVPKTERESIVRALGEPGQTRTWNLLIDVVAQSGRYPPNATSLTNGFVVEGEQRYWVHVAIDRFTKQVIAKQIEVVNE